MGVAAGSFSVRHPIVRPPCGSHCPLRSTICRMWSALMPLLPASQKRTLGLLRK